MWTSGNTQPAAHGHQIDVELDLREALAGRLSNPADHLGNRRLARVRLDAECNDVGVARGKRQQPAAAARDQDRQGLLDGRRPEPAAPALDSFVAPTSPSSRPRSVRSVCSVSSSFATRFPPDSNSIPKSRNPLPPTAGPHQSQVKTATRQKIERCCLLCHQQRMAQDRWRARRSQKPQTGRRAGRHAERDKGRQRMSEGVGNHERVEAKSFGRRACSCSFAADARGGRDDAKPERLGCCSVRSIPQCATPEYKQRQSPDQDCQHRAMVHKVQWRLRSPPRGQERRCQAALRRSNPAVAAIRAARAQLLPANAAYALNASASPAVVSTTVAGRILGSEIGRMRMPRCSRAKKKTCCLDRRKPAQWLRRLLQLLSPDATHVVSSLRRRRAGVIPARR